MRINYNVSSIIARNALNNNDKRVSASTQKLSSGYKINSAADNAAGLAIARRMNAQIKSLQRANQNANDGLSAMNTADGAMAEMHDILQRMNELAIQAANGTNADTDREMVQNEINQLVQEIDRIASTTQFNAQNLLDGSFAYKAYTNTENAKVMSYSDGVASGTYAIGQITYYHYEDKTTMYSTKATENRDFAGNLNNITYKSEKGEITTGERYAVDNDEDKLLKSLVTSASVSQYKTDINRLQTFPDSAKVLVEDDKIVIKAENDFELKLNVNDRKPLGKVGNVTTSSISSKIGTGNAIISTTTSYASNVTGSTVVTTTSYSKVTTYRNIAVDIDGKRYDIKELNFFNNVDSEGTVLTGDVTKIYTRFDNDKGRDLKDDFAEYFKEKNPDCSIEIESVAWNDKKNPGEFTIMYTAVNGKTGEEMTNQKLTCALYQEKNDHGEVMKNQKGLDHYKYSETETTRTQYTLGSGEPKDCILFDVTKMGAMIVQTGANEGQYMELEIPALNAVNLGIDKVDLGTAESARLSIDVVGNAINQLSSVRARIGAYTNRLEHTITNLDTTEENITASYSRIMDVDMATEMTEYSTVQVLVQASTSMLAQANERPQQVLQLLQ